MIRSRDVLLVFSLFLVSVLGLGAQEAPAPVSIQVHADRATGAFDPVWNFFGYDEPNYTYAPNGKKLLGQIAGLSSTPAYIRVHNLLTSGDGSGSLKWGSTNAYTEDAAGNPVYNWRIIDQIFDTLHQQGLKPLVELGFMPEALSTRPEPYRHSFPNGSIFTGWSYPPKDYSTWGQLIFHLVQHLRERYGDAEVKTWLWEVWNEPDIPYWQGTPEEYFKLYDYSVDAVLRALPGARVGGPDATGISERSAKFLTDFLQHCDTGRNFATGKQGAPLTFISYHPKGAPAWQDNHMQMGVSTQLKAVERGFKIVAASPKWHNTPIILGEFDPDGCAACTPQRDPRFGYRNVPLYAAYTADAISHTLALAQQEHVKLEGIVTWAFEFENQSYFEGYRALATNGVNEPIFNLFRMLGLLGPDRIEVTDPAALDAEQVVQNGVRGDPDIGTIATRSDHAVEVFVWNYHDDDIPVQAASIDLTISGLPKDAQHALLQHFRVDSDHSNAFAVWKAMGSPQSPTPDQQKELESAGQLHLLTSPHWIDVHDGATQLRFELPREGLSLIRIAW